MTEDKQKKEDDEVTEEQLDDVAGGSVESHSFEEMNLSKQMGPASANLFRTAIQGNSPGIAEIDFVDVDDDEDDSS